LDRVVPGVVTSYHLVDTISQANAEGQQVVVHYNQKQEEEDDVCTKLFIKRVDARKYAENKSWADLRRTLLYARTETRFYQEFLPKLNGASSSTSSSLAPHCYLAESNLDGLQMEGSIWDVSQSDPPPALLNNDETEKEILLQGKGATLVLDSIPCPEEYYQESPLTDTQAKQSLSALAKLHACAWQDVALLQLAEERLSKTVYYLPLRNPNELKGMEESWNNFLTQFEPPPGCLVSITPSIQKLGQRMFDMAEYVSNELSPQPTDPYVTICHGDYKAMNVFLPHDDTKDVIMIDFASIGMGYGMCDVAMHLIHARMPSMDAGTEEEEELRLVDRYLNELEKYKKEHKNDHYQQPYPRDVALRHYRLAVVDYFRFILGRFWKGATPEAFESRQHNQNTVLVNRNIPAAFSLIQKVDEYLQEFETERSSKQGRNE
jgi:thiamine kinase-like enzyme